MRPGDVFYLAYPSDVVRCVFVEEGDGGFNFKRRKLDPVIVKEDGEEEPGCVERSALFTSPFAAAIASAEMARKIEEEFPL